MLSKTEEQFRTENWDKIPFISGSSFFNQSINQSTFYGANIPSKARLSGATAKSVFNSKIEETVP